MLPLYLQFSFAPVNETFAPPSFLNACYNAKKKNLDFVYYLQPPCLIILLNLMVTL